MSKNLLTRLSFFNRGLVQRRINMSTSTKKIEAPYGKWKSPITVDLLTGSSIAIAGFQAVGKNDLYFLESRPFESGRSVLVKMDGDGNTEDVVSKTANVRTKVQCQSIVCRSIFHEIDPLIRFMSMEVEASSLIRVITIEDSYTPISRIRGRLM